MPVPNSIDELSTNPAENYPAGTEPVFPNLDNYIRFHAACIASLRDEVAAGGLPLAGSMWWGGARSKIRANLKPVDGDVLQRANYPALWQFVSTGGYPLVSETDWLADKAKRASFSSGDGATTFRMPDLNGKQANSIGAVVLRGDGAMSAGQPGLLQDSQNKQHTHGATTSQSGAHTHPVSGATSADGGHSHGVGSDYRVALAGGGWDGWAAGSHGNRSSSAAGSHSHAVTGTAASSGGHTHDVTVSSSGGEEARMMAATGCYVMRVI